MKINEIKKRIQWHLVRQIDIYEKAIPVAGKLAINYDMSQEQQTELTKLEGFMAEAFEENRQMAELVSQAPEISKKDPQISSTSRQLAAQISQMMEHLDSIEARAQAVRKRLSPVLDRSVRARKMQSAYSNL